MGTGKGSVSGLLEWGPPGANHHQHRVQICEAKTAEIVTVTIESVLYLLNNDTLFIRLVSRKAHGT